MYNPTRKPNGKLHVFYAMINFSNTGVAGRGDTKKRKIKRQQK